MGFSSPNATTWYYQFPFYVLVTALFLALAVGVFLRAKRREWMITLGLLLAFGAVERAFDAWSTWYPRPHFVQAHLNDLNHITNAVDVLTSVLMMHLALVFPEPLKLFRGRPWLLRALSGAFYVAWVTLLFTDPGDLTDKVGHHFVSWANFWYSHLPGTLAWLAVLIRWTHAMVKDRVPEMRRELVFLFAAIGMRAIQVSLDGTLGGIYTYDDRARLATWSVPLGPYIAQHVELALPVAVGVWAIIVLARAATDADRVRVRGLTLVVACLVIGLMHATLRNMVNLVSYQTWFGPFNAYAVIAVRPIFVWVAVLSPPALAMDRLKGRIERWVLAGYGGLVAGLGVFLLVLAKSHLSRAIPPGLLVGTLVGVAWWFALRVPIVSSRAMLVDDADAAVEEYLTTLEVRQAGSLPNRRSEGVLVAMRKRLGLTDEQHDALLATVISRSTVAATERWVTGDRIGGRYRVDRFLGKGSIGEAYLATDERASRQVVLKRTTSLDPEARRTLLNEAAALKALGDAPIVRLLDTARHRGEVILVLEWMPRGSLQTRLRNSPMAVPDVLAMAERLLSALAEVHRVGLVHGDIKPANILFDPSGRPCLADFGQARRPAPRILGNPTVADLRQGGTVRYAAPEMLRGAPATASSDLYAVGLVMAEALTGTPPAAGIDDEMELRSRILAGLRPELPDGTPAAVASLIASAVSTSAERRPEDALEFLSMVQALSGPSSETAEGSDQRRPRRRRAAGSSPTPGPSS